MELSEAIKEVKELLKHKNDYDNAYGTQIYRPYAMSREDYEPIEVILTALDERYNKGYQDGFHSARYDKYINEIHGEGESSVKYLAIEKAGYLRGYADGFKQAKFDCEMDKLDGR